MMDIIQNIVNKLQLLGYQVKFYNSFGIAYRDSNNNLSLYKITPTSSRYDIDNIEKCSRISFGEHFIITNRLDKSNQNIDGILEESSIRAHEIYIKDKKDSLFGKRKYLCIWGNFGNIYDNAPYRLYKSRGIYRYDYSYSMQDVIVVTDMKHAYVINSQGNKLELQVSIRHLDDFRFSVIRMGQDIISVRYKMRNKNKEIVGKSWELDNNLEIQDYQEC